MGGCLTLTIVGGVAEIVGFGLAFYEMAVTQRREFPEYRPLHHRALNWAGRKLGIVKPKIYSLSGTATARASASARVQVTRGPAPEDDLKARIARLEAITDDLRREQEGDRKALEERLAKAEQSQREAETALKDELARLEQARKENLRESIAYEKVGIGLFMAGVVLSVLGNAITC